MKENYIVMKQEAESKKAKEDKQASDFRTSQMEKYKEWLKRKENESK